MTKLIEPIFGEPETEEIPYPLQDAAKYAARFGNTDAMNLLWAMYHDPELTAELRAAGMVSVADSYRVKGDRAEQLRRAKADTLGHEMNESIKRRIPSGLQRVK